jgi:hypothetical protein
MKFQGQRGARACRGRNAAGILPYWRNAGLAFPWILKIELEIRKP